MPFGLAQDDSAAYAPNWLVVVAIDALMGVAALAGGLAIAVVASAWGTVLAVLGALYLFFVGGRATRWRRLRREAGL